MPQQPVSIGLDTTQTAAVLFQAGNDQHRAEWDRRLSLGDFGFALDMADAVQQLAVTAAQNVDAAVLQQQGVTRQEAIDKAQKLADAIRNALA